jgi:acetylornithine deacetylase
VVGEEMMEQQLGTIACLERGYRADAAVVAEPSPHALPLTVCAASCGFLLCEVTVEGKGTHSAMRAETIRPGRAGEVLGVHAIDHAIPVYDAVRRLEEQWGVDKRHPLFPPGSFTVHAGVAVGAPHRSLFPFSLAEYMRFTYVVWYPPDESAEDIKAEIEHQISHAAALDPWLREHPPEVVWPQHWAPARLEDPDHPIVAATGHAHERATGMAATVGGFTAVSDATFLCDAGVPAISYGPGDIAAAHAIDEHVAVDELVAAARTFALLAADWCGTA